MATQQKHVQNRKIHCFWYTTQPMNTELCGVIFGQHTKCISRMKYYCTSINIMTETKRKIQQNVKSKYGLKIMSLDSIHKHKPQLLNHMHQYQMQQRHWKNRCFFFSFRFEKVCTMNIMNLRSTANMRSVRVNMINSNYYYYFIYLQIR